MFRRFSTNFAIFSLLLDALLVVGSLYAASTLRPFLNELPFIREIGQPSPLPWPLFPVFATIWVAIFLLFAVYDGRRHLFITDELTSLTLGSLLSAGAIAGTLYLSYRDLSRALFLAFVLVTFSSMVAWRVVARLIFRIRNGNSRQTRRVLVIGAGPVGREIDLKIHLYPFLGLKMVGYLDDDLGKRSSHQSILGPIEAARQVALRESVDDVVIALPRRAYEKVNQLVAELHDLPVKVWVIPDYFHLALHKASVEEFAGLPMLDLRAPALNDYQRMVKRLFDLTLVLAVLPIAAIVMLVIGIAIRLEGSGPIFFRQKRVGENGRIFNMVKFRTMIPEAEAMQRMVEKFDDHGQLVHKSADDPRITRVGRFLRRTSLDELPQLINILRGEMSLVGPRPEMPYLVDRYEPWQHKRLAVPQGLTGWWQVNGRSDKPMHLHTEDDIYYVQNYSLGLDLKILVKTIWVVLRGKGAY